MTRDLALGLLRHFLTMAFTMLAARGLIGGVDVEQFVGAALVLANVAWFIFDKVSARKPEPAAPAVVVAPVAVAANEGQLAEAMAKQAGAAAREAAEEATASLAKRLGL